MDVGSRNAYPSCALSNFAPHEFCIDDMVAELRFMKNHEWKAI